MSASGEPMYPKQAGNLKKGDYIVMKDVFPCKVSEISTSKTGKHGHAKCSITAIDIFTGKKYEDSCPSSHNVMCPNVSRTDYLLINLDDEYAFYFDQNDAEQQVKLPLENDELLADLRAAFEAGDKSVLINIQRAMNTEGIVGFKTENIK